VAEGILWYGYKPKDDIEDSISDKSHQRKDLEKALEENNIQLKRRRSAQNWNGYE